jgi:tetratricopeptide (TPR) repeat protein
LEVLPEEAKGFFRPGGEPVKFDTHRLCAAFVFVASLIVYTLTMADSVSFWDCGEYTACSYTMSVPHPPGVAVYLLVGRIFSMLPTSSDISVRVTWLSVVASAIAILLAYLIIVRLVRHARGREETVLDKIITYGGGMIGSLSLAWSYSMWFNAVESEVYAASQLMTHLVVWLILVWHEKADEPGNERRLLLIAYVVGLSIGVHLLMVLTIPVLALVIYFRRHEFAAKSFAGMIAATGVVFVLIYPGVVKWLPNLASKTSFWAVLVVVLAIASGYAWAASKRHGIIGVGMAGLLLIILGYSTYSMIYIRSSMDPPIDENDPDTPERFFSYVNREQYGERAMFPRMWQNDPEYTSESDYFWSYQVNKMFNRYLLWQFVGREGAPDHEFQDAGVEPNYSILSYFFDRPNGFLRWLAIITCLPLLLGFIGFFYQFGSDKTGWLWITTLFFMTGYAIILYLNQDNPQPRERDYSYVGAFFAFALWIGLGASAVIEWVAKKLKDTTAAKNAAIASAAVMMLLGPGILLADNYRLADRSGNYVAWDYSYNMLMSCEPNAILFTNGDNDTFPVWYLQEVEGVRKDVRIANLSLLNTGWYIRQLKDRDPKVPISFSDAYIDRNIDQHDAQALMSRYWPEDRRKIELSTPEGKMTWTVPAAMHIPIPGQETQEPNFLRVQDIMILDILRSNYDRARTPTPKPIYFAVTVANSNMVGLKDYLSMQGLVFKLNPRGDTELDTKRLEYDLLNTFKGHFRGINDPSVHFDDNVSKLLQNYRSAFLQLAYNYRNLPDPPDFTPYESSDLDDNLNNFSRLSYHKKALVLMHLMDRLIPEDVRPISNVELSLQLGRMFHELGDPDGLKKRLRWAEERDALDFDSKALIASLWLTFFQDTAKADDILNRALGDAPTSQQYYSAGTQMYSAGSPAVAARYFKKSLELDPSSGQAIGGLLQSYERAGDFASAASELDTWIAAHPSDQGARRRLESIRARLLSDTSVSRN